MNKVLELNNISMSFGGVKALNDVSFDVYEHEILGLIGPNGSGKSTCVNVISGLYIHDSGDVIIEGENVNRKTIKERVQMGVSRTFQTPRPFVSMNVFDSVYTIFLQRYSKKDAADKTKSLLQIMGLDDLSETLSEKLPIEKRKWLDLSRCLALDPKIIMMDEVMAGLNPTEMLESLELVRRIRDRGITVLFIEHVMKAVVNVCERVIVLNEGEVLCSGEPNEVLDRDDVIAAYIGGSTDA